MIRNLKALALALVAVFAMSAIAASGAQATTGHAECTTGVETCEIKVTQHPELPTQSLNVPGAGTVKCQEFHAVAKGGPTFSSNVTLSNVKTGLCTFLGLEATVTFEGTAGLPCDYRLSSPVTEVAAGHYTGSISIAPFLCRIIYAVFGCTLTVEGEQSFTNAITYTNVKTNNIDYITAHKDTGKTVKVTGKGPACEGLESTEARYTGTFTAKGFTTNGAEDGVTIVNT